MAALELEVVALAKEIRDLIFRMSLPEFRKQLSVCPSLLVQNHATLEAEILVTSLAREREVFFIGPPGGLDVRLR